MNDLLTYPNNDYRLYLMHHQVKGAHWGIRKAEWYPIAAWEASKKAAGKAVEVIKKRSQAKKEAAALAEKKQKQAAVLEKARQTKAENRAREEAEKASKAEEDRVLKSGTKDEILKYVGKVDNATLSNALQNRINLDQKIAQVQAEKVTKFESALYKAEKLGKIAVKIGGISQDLSSGYSQVIKVLEDSGLIAKKKSKVYKNVKEIQSEIYSKILNGQIKPEEYEKYSKAVSSLERINKAANSQIDLPRFHNEAVKLHVEETKKKNEEVLSKARDLEKDVEQSVKAAERERKLSEKEAKRAAKEREKSKKKADKILKNK